jgi:hypothetical protein
MSRKHVASLLGASAALVAYLATGAALLRWEARTIADRGTWLAALIATGGLWVAGVYPLVRALARRDASAPAA